MTRAYPRSVPGSGHPGSSIQAGLEYNRSATVGEADVAVRTTCHSSRREDKYSTGAQLGSTMNGAQGIVVGAVETLQTGSFRGVPGDSSRESQRGP